MKHVRGYTLKAQFYIWQNISDRIHKGQFNSDLDKSNTIFKHFIEWNQFIANIILYFLKQQWES